MDLDQLQEFLLDENANLRNIYKMTKDLYLCFQQRLLELEDTDERKILLIKKVLKYCNPPPQVDVNDPAKSPSQITEDLKRNSRELRILHRNMTQAMITLQKELNDFFYEGQYNKISCTLPLPSPQDLETNKFQLQEMESLEVVTKDFLEETHILSNQKYWDEDKKRCARAENIALHTKLQSLLESHEDLKEQLEDAENLQSFNENVLEELKEEVNVLCQRVKLLEDRLQTKPEPGSINQTPEPGQKTKKKTNRPLEKDWNEEICSLTRQKCEAKDRADDLQEQLKRTQHVYKIYGNIIKKYYMEGDALRDRVTVLTNRLQKSKYKNFFNFLCPEWRKRQEDIGFLVKQKRLAKDTADDLREQLERAQNISSIYGILIEQQHNELDSLLERVRMLDKRLQSHQLSWKQTVLCLVKKSHREENNILIRQKHDVKKRAKDLEKQLKETQHIYIMYKTLIGKLQEEEDKLYQRVRVLDDKLQKVLNQPSLCKRIFGFFCPK